MEKRRKRISIGIPVPAIALKRFIEKAIQDDDFFIFALENPLGAMKECGVNLDVDLFSSEDFATFFGALSGAKEMVKKKNMKDLSFESIFGQAAEIRGATLMAEMTQGFCQEFDKGAHLQKGRFFSMSKQFALEKGRKLFAFKSIKMEPSLKVEMVGQTVQESETTRGRNVDWTRDSSFQDKKSNEYTHTKFEKGGAISLEDLFSGPLIYPEDLAALAARIESYIRIEEVG